MSRTALAAPAAIIAATATVGCFPMAGPAGPLVHEHHDVERGAATQASVSIDMSAGDLEVRSGAAKLFEGDFDFNVPVLKPSVAYSVSGGLGALKISQESSSGDVEHRWHLRLDDKTPVDLSISLGAGDSDLVLGSLNLRSLEVRLGAGDLKLDLRGTPASSYRVKVQAGAGDTTIELPASVAISAATTGLIGDSNMNGLEKRGGRWINPKAEGSPVTVTVDVQHAIGDLRVSAE